MEEDDRILKVSNIEEVSFDKLENSLDIEDWNYISKFETYIAVDINLYAEKWGIIAV